MTVAQFKKLLDKVDKNLTVVCKTEESFYDFDHIYTDQLENYLICKLTLL